MINIRIVGDSAPGAQVPRAQGNGVPKKKGPSKIPPPCTSKNDKALIGWNASDVGGIDGGTVSSGFLAGCLSSLHWNKVLNFYRHRCAVFFVFGWTLIVICPKLAFLGTTLPIKATLLSKWWSLISFHQTFWTHILHPLFYDTTDSLKSLKNKCSLKRILIKARWMNLSSVDYYYYYAIMNRQKCNISWVFFHFSFM